MAGVIGWQLQKIGKEEEDMRNRKGDLAVLGICVRSSIYKLFVILAGMAVLEYGLFRRMLREELKQIAEAKERNLMNWVLKPFENMVQSSQIQWIFLGCFVLFAIALAWSDSERGGSRPGYLMRRLHLGPGRIFALRAGYHVLAFALLFLVQIALAAVFGQMYVREIPEEYVTGQTIWLAFYRNDFLHSLFPMEEILRVFRNVLIILASGIETAFYGYVSYELGSAGRKKHLTLILWTAYVALCFVQEIGAAGRDIVTCIVALCGILFSALEVLGLWGKKAYEN